jgi:two-component system, chemotaxis family, protein-glutamate methylesterase/glutaminase
VPGHDIIVVGASAGGVEALITLVSGLPADLPAAVFVVLHIPAQSPSLLPPILSRAGPLVAGHPADNTPIQHGRIYVAPPDHHLLLEEGRVRVVRGPKENRHRPAVDPLMRSAARSYGPRVIGVILTGSLDDGTAGLMAVKTRGGVAVVQDPSEALYPSMPRSALDHVAVDHCLSIREIPPLLARLVGTAADAASYPVPRGMELEARIAGMDMQSLQSEERPGPPSTFSCPECNGVLYEIHDGDLTRFRCRVGHAFSAETMMAEQSEALETALWMALNTLEESAMLSRRLLIQARERGHATLVQRFAEKVQEAELRAGIIRQVLMRESPIAAPSEIDKSGDGQVNDVG